MDEIEFTILFRKPQYPVIVVSADRLYAARTIKQLAKSCVDSILLEDKSYIQIIDSTGSEFWYSRDYYSLSPGFTMRKWTKKEIIEIYKNSTNARIASKEYSMKSLSIKRLDIIIREICELMKS